VKLFERGIGYKQLHRSLLTKWAPKGDFALLDSGCGYYVARFSNLEDYNHVMTQGPWLIRDNYLTIRKWVPNFVSDEEPIRFLTAWIRIPFLSIEYFNEEFLCLIGENIGKVQSVDQSTTYVKRGKFTRMSVQVDLSKPLLSKFRLNGRVWRIQYEGL